MYVISLPCTYCTVWPYRWPASSKYQILPYQHRITVSYYYIIYIYFIIEIKLYIFFSNCVLCTGHRRVGISGKRFFILEYMSAPASASSRTTTASS